MTTHKEQIDVPDNWTVEEVSPAARNHCGEYAPAMVVYLKPLPPPEPPILPCPVCGAPILIHQMNPPFHLHHENLYKCIFEGFISKGYPTRLAAIQAANRRAT